MRRGSKETRWGSGRDRYGGGVGWTKHWGALWLSLNAPEAGDADAPSELLGPLLEEWHDVLVKHVLSRLDPTDPPTAPCSRGWGSRGWRWWWPTSCRARGSQVRCRSRSRTLWHPSRCWLGPRPMGAQ